MNRYRTAVITSIVGLSLLAAAPVLAQDDQQGGNGQMPPPMHIWGDRGEGKGGGPMQFLGLGIMQGKGEMMGRSIGGKVTSVSAPNFTLEIPAMRDKATTTVTVATNASTTFMLGRSSASWNDVAVGDFALVEGRYASSTQTLTALRVNLSTSTPGVRPMDGKGDEGKRPMMGSTTPDQLKADITARLSAQFATSTTPDVVKNIVQAIFSSIFGFFHR